MASNTGLSTKPTIQSIVDDVKDCVEKLKGEFNDFGKPVNDDDKTLQRFCVKLEFLLRHEQIEKSSFLGGRKDYWNYFIEGLNSVKGVTDGLKFVKAHSELKTNSGRGRGFIRFCLMYQRLADCLQLCISNTKLTSQWYRSGSVWRNGTQSAYLISSLYDLNDITFDLGAHGYDLDNGWPTFSRSEAGLSGQRWNLSMSRSSSISSLNHSGLAAAGSPWMSSSFVDSQIVHEESTSEEHYGTCHSLADPDPNQSEDIDQVDHKAELSVLKDENLLLKTEKNALNEQVADLGTKIFTLTSSESHKQSQISEMEKRLMDLEQRNSQLVENLQQLAQDKSSTASSQIDNLTKIQELMTKLSVSESTNSASQREVDRLSMTNTHLETEIDKLQQLTNEQGEKITHLNYDKSNLEDNLATIANSLMEKSQLIEKITESHNNEKSQLLDEKQSLHTTHVQLESEHRALQTEFTAVTQNLNRLKSANVELELTQTNAADLSKCLDSQIQSIQTKYQETLHNNTQLTQELEVLRTNHNIKLAELENGKHNMETTLTTQLDASQTKLSDSESELSVLRQQLKSTQEAGRRSATENERLKSDLWSRDSQICTLQEKVTSQETLCNQVLGQLSELQTTQSSLQQEHETLKHHHASQQTANAQLQEEKAELAHNLKGATDSLKWAIESAAELNAIMVADTATRTEQDEKLERQNTSILELKDLILSLEDKHSLVMVEIETLRSSLEESEHDYTVVRGKHDLQLKQNAELEKQLVNIHTSHESLEHSKQELEECYEELKTNYQALEEEREVQTVGLSEIELELSTLREEHQTLQETLLSDLNEQQQGTLRISMEYDRLNATNSDLQAEVNKANQAHRLANQEREDLLFKLEQEEKTKQSISSDLVQVTEEITELRSTLKSLKSEELERSKELNEVQSRLESTKLELGNRQTVMEQQLGALRFQLSSQQMEADLALQGYREQQMEVATMGQTISTQERIIAAIEIQLDSLQDERQLETTTHKQLQEELIKLLDEKEAELIELTDELDGYRNQFAAVTDANESLTESIIQIKLNNTEHQAKNENELHQLREDNNILKKRLVKLIKDKDSLWQTTDALIFKQKKLTAVKWMDDSNVYNCMGCRATFSLLLRKHHCRLCGRIFCWQCSNNWLDTTASSKKSRACNQCFIEQSQVMPDSVNSSSITSDGDADSVSLPVEINSRNWATNNTDVLSPESDNSSRQSSIGTAPSKLSTESNDVTSPGSRSSLARDPLPESSEGQKSVKDPENADESPPSVFESPGINTEENEAPLLNIASLPVKINSADADEFDEITEEEVARSLSESHVSELNVSESHVSSAAKLKIEMLKTSFNSVLSSTHTMGEDLVTEPLGIEMSYTVCVIVDKQDTPLSWRLNSLPKGIHFSLRYQTEDSNAERAEVLIPECRCNSHKQEVKGEMISHNTGLYIFSFSNKTSKSIEMSYNIGNKTSDLDL